MAKIGRPPRTVIPKGTDAEEELRRINRNTRRRERAERRKLAEQAIATGEDPIEYTAIDGDLSPPTGVELRDDLMYAFNALGGRAYLVQWGQRYPKEFFQLWSKICIPKDAEEDAAEGSGDLESLLKQLDKQSTTVQ